MSPYEPSANFRCDGCCITFRRDQCGIFRGKLVCPKCLHTGTLQHQPEKEKASTI